MIAVQDLCIGNWVYDGELTQFPMQVVGIGKDYVYLDFEGNEGDLWESTPEDLQGIPITKELLEKNAFKDLMNDECTLYTKRIKVSEKSDISISFSIDCGSISIAHVTHDNSLKLGVRLESYTSKAKYLHELQNFYRMTTKQELKINL